MSSHRLAIVVCRKNFALLLGLLVSCALFHSLPLLRTGTVVHKPDFFGRPLSALARSALHMQITSGWHLAPEAVHGVSRASRDKLQTHISRQTVSGSLSAASTQAISTFISSRLMEENQNV